MKAKKTQASTTETKETTILTVRFICIVGWKRPDINRSMPHQRSHHTDFYTPLERTANQQCLVSSSDSIQPYTVVTIDRVIRYVDQTTLHTGTMLLMRSVDVGPLFDTLKNMLHADRTHMRGRSAISFCLMIYCTFTGPSFMSTRYRLPLLHTHLVSICLARGCPDFRMTARDSLSIHTTLVPSGISLSGCKSASSVSVNDDSIMHSESTPTIDLGSRFTIATTCLPSSCSLV